MSDTTEEPGAPTPEPEPTPAPAPAPAPEGDEQEPEQKPRDEEGRRVAQLRARLGAAEREREAQRAELEYYRRQAQQQAPAEETPEQRYQRERAQIRAEVETQIRIERFHEEAYSAYPDWDKRRDDLIKMGADAGFAALLVEMPGGVRVAAALADDPAAVQRIADIKTERGRAIALGKYAAGIESEGAAPARPPQQVTRAPPPIRPVTGRAAPTFNEYAADANTLVDRWMRQDMEQRVGKR